MALSNSRASHLSYDYFSSRGMTSPTMVYTLRVTTPGPLGQWQRKRSPSSQFSLSQPLPYRSSYPQTVNDFDEEEEEEEEGVGRLPLPDELATLRVTNARTINEQSQRGSPRSSRLPSLMSSSFHPATSGMGASMGLRKPSLSPAAYEAMRRPPMTEEDYEEYLFLQETSRQQYLFANKRRLDAPKYKPLSFAKSLEPTFGHYIHPSTNMRGFAQQA